MNDIKKEQQMVLIITLAGISCILQNHFGNWDFWVPWIIAAAGLFIWWLFISKKTEFNVRTSVYFVFAAFLAFYHGIHEVNLFDVSTTMGLLLITFTLSDRVHACAVTLAFGHSAMLFAKTNRHGLLERAGAEGISERLVKLDMNKLDMEKQIQIQWLTQIFNREKSSANITLA